MRISRRTFAIATIEASVGSSSPFCCKSKETCVVLSNLHTGGAEISASPSNEIARSLSLDRGFDRWMGLPTVTASVRQDERD